MGRVFEEAVCKESLLVFCFEKLNDSHCKPLHHYNHGALFIGLISQFLIDMGEILDKVRIC